MVVQSTSFESIPFSFTLKILGSSPISSALARQWSLFSMFSFPSSFFLPASRSSTSKEKLAAAGFDPLTFRSKVDDLDHRTTVSCFFCIFNDVLNDQPYLGQFLFIFVNLYSNNTRKTKTSDQSQRIANNFCFCKSVQ